MCPKLIWTYIFKYLKCTFFKSVSNLWTRHWNDQVIIYSSDCIAVTARLTCTSNLQLLCDNHEAISPATVKTRIAMEYLFATITALSVYHSFWQKHEGIHRDSICMSCAICLRRSGLHANLRHEQRGTIDIVCLTWTWTVSQNVPNPATNRQISLVDSRVCSLKLNGSAFCLPSVLQYQIYHTIHPSDTTVKGWNYSTYSLFHTFTCCACFILHL